jgi:hypothetical protein
MQLRAPNVLKTPAEQLLFERYKKWLYADFIPDEIVELFTTEVTNYKLKNKKSC